MSPFEPATTTLLVLGVAVALFVWNRLPVGVVAILVALSLYATGVLSPEAALAGFGDPVVVFIAALFVVSEGIDSTGVTTWLGTALSNRAGTERTRLVTALMLLCAVLTALITPNGAVAALLPMVVVLAVKSTIPPAQLLMPLAFAAHAGSLLALTGSPVNIIVSEASVADGGPGFGFFEFALVGVPLLAGSTLLALTLGPRVLPRSVPTNASPDLSRHAETLSAHYSLEDGFYRLRVRERSPLVGVRTSGLDWQPYPGITLIGLQDRHGRRPDPQHRLEVDDVLVVTGPTLEVSHLVIDLVLAVATKPLTTADPGSLIGKEMGVVEAVVPPRSPLVGETVFPGMVRGSDLVILAVRRLGVDRGAHEMMLAEGDSLLLHGDWAAIDALVDDRDVLVVDSPDVVRRQAGPLGGRAPHALVVLAGMVLLLALGVVPPAVAALVAATAMVLLKVVGVQQAYRSVSWQTVVLIGGLIPLSTAVRDSGAADLVSSALIGAVGPGRPYLLLAALFVLAGLLGQVVSNTATSLIIVPIAVAAAAETSISAQPVLMLVAVAGAASFLTPIATPANMMIMGPSGYRFGDYWKLGLPTMALWMVLSLLIIPRIWPF